LEKGGWEGFYKVFQTAKMLPKLAIGNDLDELPLFTFYHLIAK
jgi:hypothetical protein